MSRKFSVLVMLAIGCVAICSGCVGLARSDTHGPAPVRSKESRRTDTSRFVSDTEDPAKPGKPEASGEKDGDKEKEKDKESNGNGKEEKKDEPKHIRDNAMLVEEAFNQETGVVQHIFNWVHLWDRPRAGRTRDFAFAYTMELPIGSQKHQFSFTTQILSAFNEPNGAVAAQQGGIGDTQFNYRYQLLANDDFLWCAPRLSLIVPTGDTRFGTSTGRVGYQFNLPFSRYGERFDFHFNAGGTLIPNVSLPMANGLPSPDHNLRAANLGLSAYWKPRTNLNLFLESLALWSEEIDGNGVRQNGAQVFLNPGARYAVCQFDDAEWVLGIAVPIGLTPGTPDIGIFAYMSVEHPFRKKKDGNGEGL